ncbi:unnamed protein product [Cylicocyclus nassatus]|uniref:Uncharacterized protein n=1 Tax=Cylicocyclus nassatus TaxID=53992 RepID=A0AA36DJW8_CYLNA|nr:unnamed protein product [Cylicocyclus nassatus]
MVSDSDVESSRRPRISSRSNRSVQSAEDVSERQRSTRSRSRRTARSSRRSGRSAFQSDRFDVDSQRGRSKKSERMQSSRRRSKRKRRRRSKRSRSKTCSLYSRKCPKHVTDKALSRAAASDRARRERATVRQMMRAYGMTEPMLMGATRRQSAYSSMRGLVMYLQCICIMGCAIMAILAQRLFNTRGDLNYYLFEMTFELLLYFVAVCNIAAPSYTSRYCNVVFFVIAVGVNFSNILIVARSEGLFFQCHKGGVLMQHCLVLDIPTHYHTVYTSAFLMFFHLAIALVCVSIIIFYDESLDWYIDHTPGAPKWVTTLPLHLHERYEKARAIAKKLKERDLVTKLKKPFEVADLPPGTTITREQSEYSTRTTTYDRSGKSNVGPERVTMSRSYSLKAPGKEAATSRRKWVITRPPPNADKILTPAKDERAIKMETAIEKPSKADKESPPPSNREDHSMSERSERNRAGRDVIYDESRVTRMPALISPLAYMMNKNITEKQSTYMDGALMLAIFQGISDETNALLDQRNVTFPSLRSLKMTSMELLSRPPPNRKVGVASMDTRNVLVLGEEDLEAERMLGLRENRGGLSLPSHSNQQQPVFEVCTFSGCSTSGPNGRLVEHLKNDWRGKSFGGGRGERAASIYIAMSGSNCTCPTQGIACFGRFTDAFIRFTTTLTLFDVPDFYRAIDSIITMSELRKRLYVSDLFRSLGHWNDLYAMTIALNTLVFSSVQLHYTFRRSLGWKRSDFEFHDCEGNFYSLIKENVTLFIEKQYGESGAKFTKNEFPLFIESGEACGVLLLVALFRMKTSRLLLIGALLYSICPVLSLTSSKTFVRASIFLSGVSVRLMRIPMMMHCMESLPKHLRVHALSIMFAVGVIFNMCMILYSKVVNYSLFWTHAMVAISIVTTCCLHIRFAPPDIMYTLLMAKTSLLTEELEKWVKRGKLINIDSLIDNILYRGPVFTSRMSTFKNLLRFGPLFRKTAICACLLPLGSLIFSSSFAYLHDRLSYGAYESDFMSNICSLLGLVVTVYLCPRLGRRLTLTLMLSVAIMSQILLLNLRLESYNACRRMNSPQGWRLFAAHLTYACGMISATVLLIVPRVILMEHVPTSLRSLVPLAFVYLNVTVLIRIAVQHVATRLSKAYPNAGLIYSLGYAILVAPFALLLDDSTHLPINTAEIPVFTPPRTVYPKHMDPNDTPSERFSVRMMLQACAAAQEAKMHATAATASAEF